MIDSQLDDRIKKLEYLVTNLCVSTQAYTDEVERMIIKNSHNRISHHARKSINTQKLEQEYWELKSKLEMMEQDYPELKK